MTRIILVIALLLASLGHADPLCDSTCLHHKKPAKLTTESGNVFDLPPGYTIPEEKYNSLDAELKRLQDTETRLTAENTSLRKSARSSVGWVGVVSAIGLGLTVGVLVGKAL